MDMIPSSVSQINQSSQHNDILIAKFYLSQYNAKKKE